MSNKTYDSIKLIALIAVPVCVFLSTLLDIWHVPHATELTATLAAVDALLGSIVKIAQARYMGGADED